MFLLSLEDFTIWIWLSVFVIALILEASTNDLVSIWFSLGALVSLCICYFAPWWVELIVFMVISVVTLIFTRPLFKKMLKNQIRKTNSDEFIGLVVKTIKEISQFNPGEIKLNGIIYTAILSDGSNETIKEDELVTIVTMKGNKAVVKKVEEK